MCAVPNMAVFCSSLTSWFPGMLLTYFLNDLEMVIIIITTTTTTTTTTATTAAAAAVIIIVIIVVVCGGGGGGGGCGGGVFVHISKASVNAVVDTFHTLVPSQQRLHQTSMAFLNIWLFDVYKEQLHHYFIVKILIWILNFV